MKKLLTLVLALVLVFAIAAPALAITGDTEDEDEGPDLVDVAELDLALFAKEPIFTQFAGFQLSEIAANKAYIVNEVAYYGVAVHFIEWKLPDPDEETEPKMDPDDFEGATLTISTDAMNLRSIAAKDIYRVNKKGKVTDHAGLRIAEDDNEVSVTGFPVDDWGTGATIYLFGEGIVTGKGVLKAEFALEKKVGTGNPGLDIFDGRDFLYNVRCIDGDFIVVDEDGIYVKFDVNADKEVDDIFVSIDSGATWEKVQYVVPVSGGGAVVGKIGDLEDDEDEDDDEFDTALAAYEAVMEFFGFDYDAEGVLLAKHFEKKASGLNLKAEVAIQLYTAAIVIPGGVEPPKTGDAATVIGFVMIVLAMVAAGVVVSRKVRA